MEMRTLIRDDHYLNGIHGWAATRSNQIDLALERTHLKGWDLLNEFNEQPGGRRLSIGIKQCLEETVWT
jgi:hypothetical protein